jgi:hypothetical protein
MTEMKEGAQTCGTMNEQNGDFYDDLAELRRRP